MVYYSALLLPILVSQFLEWRPEIMHPPPQFLGRERVELVVQTPVHADYAFRLEAMLADVVRERIDFRRPSWVIVRVRPEMKRYTAVL